MRNSSSYRLPAIDNCCCEVSETFSSCFASALQKGESAMPLKRVKQAATADKRRGKSASTQAGHFVEQQMKEMERGEGNAKSRKQAIAIGLSEARRSGVNVPDRRSAAKKKASASSRKRSSSSSRTGSSSTGSSRTGAKKSTAKKSATKRSTSHRSTAKKTTAKKSTAKRSTAKKTTAGRRSSKRTAVRKR